MSKIYKSLVELVGSTPLLELKGYVQKHELKASIIGKLEYYNPAGSVKDRIAKAMLEDAEKKGLLAEGSVIVEPTSGNTGIGLASVAAAKGYRIILTMPETMSVERRNLLKAYGAELVLTPGDKGMKGAIAKAEELAAEKKKAFITMQFATEANTKIHQRTTAAELLADTEGKIDIFVAGSGTGGTLTGVGTVLKQYDPAIKIIAVEPEGSPIISKNQAGKHGIYGIGPGFIPKNLNVDILDMVETISDQQAKIHTHMLSKRCGILAGISSGAALAIALKHAREIENKGKTIVVILPDTGERYLSSHVFDEV